VRTECPFHSFDVTFKEARKIQNDFRASVEITDSISCPDDVDFVGGADVAFIKLTTDLLKNKKEADHSREDFSPNKKTPSSGVIAIAAVVVYDVKKRCIVETSYSAVPVYFPYVPGFLSFREGPAVLRALGELSVLPGVLIYDGCGIAHPRGLGLASHMSILTGIPSIGCAKSLLCGSCDEPGVMRGEKTFITLDGRIVGCCLRTRSNIAPVYVSPGSGFSVDSAREFVLSLAFRYRLPEPTRLAHTLVTEYKKKSLSM
jgi:deoxyribonuclease V